MTNIIPPVSGSDVLKIDVYTHSSLAVLHHAAPFFCPWEAAGGSQRLFSNREGYGERERDRGDRPNVTLRVTFGAVPQSHSRQALRLFCFSGFSLAFLPFPEE